TTFCKCESKFCPSMVTAVPGGPLSGVTRVIRGGGASYVNTPVAEPQVPSGLTTTTFAAPGEFAGEVTKIGPESTTFTADAGSPPQYTCAPERKLEPDTVMGVPPSLVPVVGDTVIPRGARSVMTSAPVTIEASTPRLTDTSIGPMGVSSGIERSICALVEATDEILPAKLGAPRKIPGFELLKTTPAVRSSPPTVSLPLIPRMRRVPKAGLVRFRPVVLFGSVSISAVAVAPAVKEMVCASDCVDTFPKYVVPKSVRVLA